MTNTDYGWGIERRVGDGEDGCRRDSDDEVDGGSGSNTRKKVEKETPRGKLRCKREREREREGESRDAQLHSKDNPKLTGRPSRALTARCLDTSK
jgi:hypothetical protein